MQADEHGYWLPDAPLELRAACIRALEGGAIACTYAGAVVACNVARLAEQALEVAPLPPRPRSDGAARCELDKLAICRKCENWKPAAHACGLVTRTEPDGSESPCWNRLRERIVRGLPCVHPEGNKWATPA